MRLCILGSARLSDCWIVIANYIPFHSFWLMTISKDKIFKVKQKSRNTQKLEPSKFFSYIYMVNFVLGKNINRGHKCIDLGGRSIVVVKQWDKILAVHEIFSWQL